MPIHNSNNFNLKDLNLFMLYVNLRQKYSYIESSSSDRNRSLLFSLFFYKYISIFLSFIGGSTAF